jgi:hypothetical protein
LWRKSFIASSAPGQPPKSSIQWSVLSLTRHAPRAARRLSSAYVTSATRLATA